MLKCTENGLVVFLGKSDFDDENPSALEVVSFSVAPFGKVLQY